MEIQKIYTNDNGIVSAFAESRIGGRPENQDSYGWQENPRGYLVTVCDGMGGGPGGKTASTIAVKEILRSVAEASDDEEIPNILKKAIRNANLSILQAGSNHPNLKGMGSTATVLWVTPYAAYAAHVGDSRIYQLRGHRKVFRTFDHSMVFDMVGQGVITEEQARLSAQSNVITRALGIKPDVEVDVVELPYCRGDRFVLCTDGIHGTMPEQDLLRLLTNQRPTLGALTDDVATSIDNQGRSKGGGHDNLTIAMVETKANSKLKQPMSKKAKLLMVTLIIIAAASIAGNIVQLRKTGDAACYADSVKVLKDTIVSHQRQLSTYQAQADSMAKLMNENTDLKDRNEKITKLIKEMQTLTDTASHK